MLTAKSTFVLGGASSGKSAYAEELTKKLPGAPVYLATAQGFDDEMIDKIAAHRRRRGDGWTTVEEPYDLPAAIAEHGIADTVLLVDCLTLWLTNIMSVERDIPNETDALIAAIGRVQGCIVLVSNELGLGLVPGDELSRNFRNLHGNLNQAVAASVDRAVFVVAGLPLTLKVYRIDRRLSRGRFGGRDAGIRRSGRRWVDLSTGINPCPWPVPAAALDSLNRLPHSGQIATLCKLPLPPTASGMQPCCLRSRQPGTDPVAAASARCVPGRRRRSDLR